jgi:site-specific DNA-methyltransferase (adenine-specific)
MTGAEISRLDLHHGDSLTVLQGLPDDSMDAVVTDPPYGLSEHKPSEVADCLRAWLDGKPYAPSAGKVGFMGQAWDAWVPGPELWREVLRVLKPGGHALVFAGTRSMDLMSMALRLSGFELRDSIGYAHDEGGAPLLAWVHAQGFPKSRDISKAIDRSLRGTSGTDAAKQWEGWGTALKPAFEPIVICRKPLAEKTVADNVLRYGTGAIRINACRVPVDSGVDAGQLRTMQRGGRATEDGYGMGATPDAPVVRSDGRFPANFVHDGSGAVLSHFPESAGQLASVTRRNADTTRVTYAAFKGTEGGAAKRGDAGSAARFFYCAKPSRAEKDAGLAHFDEQITDVLGRHRSRRMATVVRPDGAAPARGRNTHPTVKPVALCRYLCRLVTPPGGTVLDPFMGSGTTGVAALQEGFGFIGIDDDSEFVAIARARCAQATSRQADLSEPLLR